MARNKHYMGNGTEIYLDKNYPLEKAIKKLSKKMQKFGIVKDYWRSKIYSSPSERKREKIAKQKLSRKYATLSKKNNKKRMKNNFKPMEGTKNV